jgi:hypothetical protein
MKFINQNDVYKSKQSLYIIINFINYNEVYESEQSL